MNNNKVEIVVVCNLAKNNQGTVHIEVPCALCGVIVGLSDSTMQAARENLPQRDFIKYPVTPYCVDCAGKKIKETKVKVLPMGTAQAEELKKLSNAESRKH